MRETAKSLRWYFGIVGLLYFYGTGFMFVLLGGLGFPDLLTGALFGSPLNTLNTLLNFVWALGYLYFAFALSKYINPEKVKYVKIFLLVPFVEMILWSIWGFLTTGIPNLYLIGSGLVTWYLYANVHRLAVPPMKVV